jgi:predicted RNase H-like nuclease (RuvC/YqgF family)
MDIPQDLKKLYNSATDKLDIIERIYRDIENTKNKINNLEKSVIKEKNKLENLEKDLKINNQNLIDITFSIAEFTHP